MNAAAARGDRRGHRGAAGERGARPPPISPAGDFGSGRPRSPSPNRRRPGRSIAPHGAPRSRKNSPKEVRKDSEKLPPGPLHIVISIKKQQLTLYAGGVPVAHSQVSTGVPGHPTPQGVFSILEKRIYHESNLYSSAPMPYMQRITWSGVAMHQGVVPGHPASHGCIRLPAAFAKRMWGLTKVGARVIIAQDEIALAEIASRRLFTALPRAVAEAPREELPAKVRFATNAVVSDAPLKGSIDANEREDGAHRAHDRSGGAGRRRRAGAGRAEGRARAGEGARRRHRERPDAAAGPDLGLCQPQARQAVRAQGLRRSVRGAGHDRAAERAARHARLHRAGSARRRHDALERRVAADRARGQAGQVPDDHDARAARSCARS